MVYFKAQELIQDLLQNALIYGNKVKDRAYPLYLFGRVGEGDAVAMLVFTIGIAAMAVFTFRLLAGSFIRIATASGKSGKAVYREKHEKRKRDKGAVYVKPELYAELWTGDNFSSDSWSGCFDKRADGVANDFPAFCRRRGGRIYCCDCYNSSMPCGGNE